MAAIEIGQLPLTTALTLTTVIPVENANVTQKIEASAIRTLVTSLEFLDSAGNVTAANLVTAGAVFASEIRSTGQIATAGQLSSTVSTGTAPLSVTSTTQVPNLYASRAAVADATTNGLTTASTFANVVATDIIIGGNNSSLTANLRTVNTDTGTFGNSTIVPRLTVDAKGRILAVSNIAITFPAQTLISNTAEITANTVSGAPGLSLTTTGVTAGTYGGAINVPQITVDTKGRVTSITSVPVNSTLNTLNIGMPIGTIALWSGALATIPDGWQICDGTNGTVNLRDRFVVGAGSLYNPGTTGGSADAALPSHTHTATSTSTFTGSQLPNHSHGITDPGHRHNTPMGFTNIDESFHGGGSNRQWGTLQTQPATTGISINDQSAGTPSGTVVTSTTLSTEGVTASNRNLPPYYALYYIQKMTDSVSINNPINFMTTVGTTTSGGNLVAASGNASISTTTGALVVVGGAGVGGNLNVGGTITSPTMPPGTANTAVATTAFVQVNGSPTGGLMMWPTATPPTGWLLCNGQAVSRVTFATLFAILGTAFGVGDNLTTFNLPNYTNRVPVGAGGLYATAATGGSKDAIVVSHTHTETSPGDFITGSVSADTGSSSGIFSGPTGVFSVSDGNSEFVSGGSTAAGTRYRKFSISAGSHTHTISTEGSSGSDANMPPYLAIYYIIKA
jgi:microcystin-dependent protein